MIHAFSSVLSNDTSGDLWNALTTETKAGRFEIFSREVFVLPQIQQKQSILSPNITGAFAGMGDDIRPLEELGGDGECETSWYGTSKVIKENNLMVLYQAEGDKSLLEPNSIEAICRTEEKTMAVLREKELCGGCLNNDQCLAPVSLIFMLRLIYFGNGFDMDCSELAQAYEGCVQDIFTKELLQCAHELRAASGTLGNGTSCPGFGLMPHLVDANFGVGGNSFLQYSTSYIHTSQSDPFDLYEERQSFGGNGSESDELASVTFETRSGVFLGKTIDAVVRNEAVSSRFLPDSFYVADCRLILTGQFHFYFHLFRS